MIWRITMGMFQTHKVPPNPSHVYIKMESSDVEDGEDGSRVSSITSKQTMPVT